MDPGDTATLSSMLEATIARTLGAQLSAITDKLDAIDARLGAVEARLSSIPAAAAPPPAASYASGMQQAAAQAMQEQLVALSQAVDVLSAVSRRSENVIADAVDNMTWALDQFAQQTAQPTAVDSSAPPSVDALPSSSDRPRSTDSPTPEALQAIASALATLTQRMQSVEAIAQTQIPELISRGLSQIAATQSHMDSEMRSLLSSVSLQTQDPDLRASLRDVQAKVQALPQLYIDEVSVSLQRQTQELLHVIDDIKGQQAEAINSVVSTSSSSTAGSILKRVSGGGSGGGGGNIIPNMGIADRISKLAVLARNRLSNEIIPADSPVLKSPPPVSPPANPSTA
ncbi:hypothetical protein HDU83_007917 [Entophlyctis luteolus]|nr:hypothetical protein HDU83_007917 [Entophlyctis luteolus]KAJ3377575.1 hypothetical protein HDU84_008514 [Entophlyctis sp. JEL0112]